MRSIGGFAACSAQERSKLISRVMHVLELHGLRVAIVRRKGHDNDPVYQIMQAGAEPLNAANIDLASIDLLLIDGTAPWCAVKIEIHRQSASNKLLFPEDKSIIAIASDEYLETGSLPLLNIDSPQEIAGYINRWLRQDQDHIPSLNS
jgi:molybdopterin-guanine dinucleotide biosynthesis protein